MKINCISCGHKVDLDDVYDTYDGQVKCFTCSAILAIKTDEGQLKKVELDKVLRASGPKRPLKPDANR